MGGEPDHFGAAPEVFHRQNAARLADYPHAMLATSTHDTKRSEDVRARLAAISEIPDAWRRAVQRFRTANRKHKRDVEGEQAPDANEEYLIYQTLAGAWPLDGVDHRINSSDASRSTWPRPSRRPRSTAVGFSRTRPGTLPSANSSPPSSTPAKRNTFPGLFRPLAEQIARLGAINSLSQTLIKLTAPGVPDIYQGNEMWDLSLVDPDNRRPVDYDARRKALAGT